MTSNALLVRKLVGEDVCFGKKIAHPSKAELGFPQPPAWPADYVARRGSGV
jgi:hypothetical protein